MKKNIFGTEIFEKFDEFVTKQQLIHEQKIIENELKKISENSENCSPYKFEEDEFGDKIYQLPLDIFGDFDFYNLSKEDEKLEEFLNSCLDHGDGIKVNNGDVYWATDLFDSLKYYENLDKDDLEEVIAGPDTNCDGKKEPLFIVKGSSITEDNESEITIEMDEIFSDIKKEWEDNIDQDLEIDMDDEDSNFGEPIPKMIKKSDISWSTNDMIDEITKDLCEKMDKDDANEIVNTIQETTSKSLQETFFRMKMLIDIEKYR